MLAQPGEALNASAEVDTPYRAARALAATPASGLASAPGPCPEFSH
jgi:hypothetical protein